MRFLSVFFVYLHFIFYNDNTILKNYLSLVFQDSYKLSKGFCN